MIRNLKEKLKFTAVNLRKSLYSKPACSRNFFKSLEFKNIHLTNFFTNRRFTLCTNRGQPLHIAVTQFEDRIDILTFSIYGVWPTGRTSWLFCAFFSHMEGVQLNEYLVFDVFFWSLKC